MSPVDEMACKELVERVTAYWEGVLTPRDRLRFETHLAECPGCRAYVEQMRQTVAALGRLGAESPPDGRVAVLDLFRRWRAQDEGR